MSKDKSSIKAKIARRVKIERKGDVAKQRWEVSPSIHVLSARRTSDGFTAWLVNDVMSQTMHEVWLTEDGQHVPVVDARIDPYIVWAVQQCWRRNASKAQH